MDARAYATGTRPNADGLQLFYRRWESPVAPPALVVIIHGQGEHSGRYVHVGKFFADAGLAAVAPDLRGHGKSQGRPGVILHYSELAADVLPFVRDRTIQRCFLFGHSLGGQLVLWIAQQKLVEVDGVIASAPWLQLTEPPGAWLVNFARILNRYVPSYRFPTGISDKKVSQDQAHLDSLEDLDLLHNFITVRMYFEAEKAAASLLASPEVQIPILLTHGDEDSVTSLQATRDFFQRLKAPSKTLRIYPGLRHELHNETERARVLNDYLEWIRVRL
ncbi:MAG: lysophospholipase [Chthoniobacterales bacterium]